MSETIYVNYYDVLVTISKDGTAFADYPNKQDIVQNIGWRMPDTTRELLSDPKRYRVYYPKNSLGKLFTDIEAVMR